MDLCVFGIFLSFFKIQMDQEAINVLMVLIL
jgi:hypothetical protein